MRSKKLTTKKRICTPGGVGRTSNGGEKKRVDTTSGKESSKGENKAKLEARALKTWTPSHSQQQGIKKEGEDREEREKKRDEKGASCRVGKSAKDGGKK